MCYNKQILNKRIIMPKKNHTKPLTTVTNQEATLNEEEKITLERNKNAHPGFFLRSATWLLQRVPLTKNRYQNWTSSRRILVGWLLWIVCLPIIPIAILIAWYVHDPEGFKKSPWAKGLIVLTIAWAGAFGLIATEPAQLDTNGKYSPVQTQPNGEKSVNNVSTKPAAVASTESAKKVQQQTKSNSSKGRSFANCTAAFEAGVYDIKRSDSSYDNKLDRDNDGIACEK
jgi:hypothetical protein